MRHRAWMLLLLMAILTSAQAHKKSDKAECDTVKEKIRTIESRMRSGYTRAQGERYEEQLRELRSKRYKVCR